jgi:hypothetical protein
MNKMRILFEDFPRLDTFTPGSRIRWNVELNTSRISAGKPLVAEYVGRAMVVVAHNELTSKGFIGHFIDTSVVPPAYMPATGHAQLEQALGRLQNLGPTELTSLWLGGGALHEEMYSGIADIPTDRRHTENRIASLGVPKDNMTVQWTTEPNKILHARLRPNVGELQIQYEQTVPPMF